MTVQHADLFHCLACGRVAYEPHGGPAPECCGQPMVRAVADVIKEMPSASSEGSPGDLTEHALFAEVVELSQWCHGLRDVDISRSEELANRLSVLYQALIDQVDDLHRPRSSATAETRDGSPQRGAERANPGEPGTQPARRLVTSFGRLVAQLRNGPSPFASWGEICDRMDELVTEFRQYVEAEARPTRLAPAKR